MATATTRRPETAARRLSLPGRWLPIVWLCWAGNAQAASLHTASYRVDIEAACAQAAEPCAEAPATIVNRLSGDTRNLLGRAIRASCARPPCPVIGYRFSDGLLTYTALASGELMVAEGQKVLVLERGGWR